MADRDVEKQLRRLAPVDRQAAEQAWLFYLSGAGAERALAEDLVDVLLYQATRKNYRLEPFLDPPSAAACTGEYRLGALFYPPDTRYADFGLRENEWPNHVLIVGMTGMGKTTLAANVLRELDRHGRPFLAFDWKQSYRRLPLPGLRVLRIGQPGPSFRFNPLVPPDGVRPGEWLMKLVDVLKHAYFVGEGVEYLLRRGIDLAYERAGWHAGKPTRTPTFEEVRAFVLQQKLQGRMSLWKASALRVLESLCFREQEFRSQLSQLEAVLDPIEDVARRVKIYGTPKPGSRTLSRFYGRERREDEALREHLLSLRVEDTRGSGPRVVVPQEMPDWFSRLLQTDNEVRDLWAGLGKPGTTDTTRSGYDFSLMRSLIRKGYTDVKDLAAVLAHRPDGAVQSRTRGDAYIWRTIANALIRG